MSEVWSSDVRWYLQFLWVSDESENVMGSDPIMLQEE